MARMKIGRFRAGKRLWEVADDEALRYLFPDMRTADLAARLGRTASAVSARATTLGVHKSAAYLASPAACRLRRENHPGIATQFAKGHAPANKGLRRPGWGPGRMKATQFKKGERRGVAVRLYKPIGAERMSKDGYLERKINDGLPLQARWRAVHLVVWEAVHGRVPRGSAIIFKNGNKADIRLDNLELITRRALMLRNSVHNYPAPIPQAVQLLGALNRQIRKRTRHAQQQNV